MPIKYKCLQHGEFDPNPEDIHCGPGWYKYLFCPECNRRVNETGDDIKILSGKEAVLKRPALYIGSDLYEKYKNELDENFVNKHEEEHQKKLKEFKKNTHALENHDAKGLRLGWVIYENIGIVVTSDDNELK